MSFQTKVASRGFHISKDTTRENVNIGQEFSVQLETNEDWSILLWYKNHGLWKTEGSRSYTMGGFKAYLLLH